MVLGRALGGADAARTAFREALELLEGHGEGASAVAREATDERAALDA